MDTRLTTRYRTFMMKGTFNVFQNITVTQIFE